MIIIIGCAAIERKDFTTNCDFSTDALSACSPIERFQKTKLFFSTDATRLSGAAAAARSRCFSSRRLADSRLAATNQNTYICVTRINRFRVALSTTSSWDSISNFIPYGGQKKKKTNKFLGFRKTSVLRPIGKWINGRFFFLLSPFDFRNDERIVAISTFSVLLNIMFYVWKKKTVRKEIEKCTNKVFFSMLHD